jgi:hypothetical protein
MGKRVLLMVVGAGMGSLVGLLATLMGAGSAGVIAGAAIGAVMPILVLGSPGK